MLTNKPAADSPHRLTVGFSGGLDSTVLLHWLCSQRPGIDVIALHCMHGLQADAERWAVHCQAVCSALAVPLHTVALDATAIRSHPQGLEAGARAQRLAALTAFDRERSVALAHQQDDQAETFLLRALRGSSLDGLAAMQRHSQYGGQAIWRPLLDTPRAEIHDYALRHHLRWIEDPSNADARFDRNYLRTQVMPLLSARWPQAAQRLARSAQLAAHDRELLRAQDVPPTSGALPLAGMTAQARARAIRQWVAAHGLPSLPETAVTELERCLQSGRSDSDFSYRWGGHCIRLWRQALHVDAQAPAWTCPVEVTVPAGESFEETFADGSRLTVRNPGAQELRIHLRPRVGGERIVLPGRRHHTAVKNVFNASDLPPWLRARVPLIYGDNDELWWIGHLQASEPYQQRQRRDGLHLTWQADDLN